MSSQKVYYHSLVEGAVAAVVVERNINAKQVLLRVTAVSKRFYRKGMLIAAPFSAVDAR